jgi:anti-sigma factor RsiW
MAPVAIPATAIQMPVSSQLPLARERMRQTRRNFARTPLLRISNIRTKGFGGCGGGTLSLVCETGLSGAAGV